MLLILIQTLIYRHTKNTCAYRQRRIIRTPVSIHYTCSPYTSTIYTQIDIDIDIDIESSAGVPERDAEKRGELLAICTGACRKRRRKIDKKEEETRGTKSQSLKKRSPSRSDSGHLIKQKQREEEEEKEILNRKTMKSREN